MTAQSVCNAWTISWCSSHLATDTVISQAPCLVRALKLVSVKRMTSLSAEARQVRLQAARRKANTPHLGTHLI